MTRKQAILSGISPDGLGYLLDKNTKDVVYFTFDKIPNYHGQSVNEINANRGDEVDYETDVRGQVVKVFLSIGQKKRFAW